MLVHATEKDLLDLHITLGQHTNDTVRQVRTYLTKIQNVTLAPAILPNESGRLASILFTLHQATVL